MLLTLDDELARLVNNLKYADWTAPYTIAVSLDGEGEVISAYVIAHGDNLDFHYRLHSIRADHWSVGDLFMDLLCSVAYGFSMTQPTGSHRYVLAMLEAIRQHVVDQEV